MRSWPTVSLAEISAKPQYGAIAKGRELPPGPLFVRQTDITGGRIDWETVPFCDLDADSAERYQLRCGDLLISRLGNGVGNAATVTEDRADAVFAGYLVRFQPNQEEADARFVGYQLQSRRWRDHVTSFRSGAAQPTLNAQQMGDFEFSLPPIAEQSAIATTLGALDDKIESNRRAISGIFDLIDAYSDKFGKDLPLVPLSALTTSVKRSINPSTLDGAVVDHFSLPAFDAGASPERVSAFTIMSNKLMVPQQAILLSRLNPRFNRTWWASVDPEVPGLASTEFLVLTATSEADLAAVWLALRDPSFRSELPRRVTGTSGSHQRVKPDDVLAMDVPDFRAANSELKQAALAMLGTAEKLSTQMAQLAALRDTMLPELLSGRIRVPVEGVEA